jgi:hypothetical protein
MAARKNAIMVSLGIVVVAVEQASTQLVSPQWQPWFHTIANLPTLPFGG